MCDGLAELGEAVDPPAGDDDPATSLGERERDGVADAAAGARDDGDGRIELHGPPRPLAAASDSFDVPQNSSTWSGSERKTCPWATLPSTNRKA